jgi:hypothetical protein
MSYIGRTPQIGAYHKLDSITCDGSTAYTMQLDSANFVPESVNHLIVSVNGVIQAPTDSFTVSSSTITFASALSSSDTIDFIMALGNVLDIGTPSDATVSLSKLTATGTKDATTFLRGDNTFAVPAGGTNTPNFFVRFNGSASTGHSHNTITKVPFNTEDFDTASAFDISSNYRFTVPSGQAGKYNFYGQVSTKGESNNERRAHYTWLYKNDSQVAKRGFFGTTQIFEGGQETITNISSTLDLSVGDYIDLRVMVYDNNSSGLSIIGDTPNNTYFTGFKLVE